VIISLHTPTLLVSRHLRKIAKHDSFLISVRPSVHTGQLESHCADIHELLYLSILWKSVDNIQVSLNSDTNNKYFIPRPTDFYGNISLNSSQNENCFQTKSVEKIETRILCSITLFRKSFHLWDNVEHDSQCRYKVTSRHDFVTSVAVEKQWVLHNLSVCICSLRYPACKAYAPYCHVTSPALQYLSTFSHKRHEFLKKKKLLITKCLFLIFSTTSV